MKFLPRKPKTIAKQDSAERIIRGPVARRDSEGRSPLKTKMDRGILLEPRLQIPSSLWRSISAHWDPAKRQVRLDGAPLSEDDRDELIGVIAALNKKQRCTLEAKSDAYLAGCCSLALKHYGIMHGEESVAIGLSTFGASPGPEPDITPHTDAAPHVNREAELRKQMMENSASQYKKAKK